MAQPEARGLLTDLGRPEWKGSRGAQRKQDGFGSEEGRGNPGPLALWPESELLSLPLRPARPHFRCLISLSPL